MADIRELVMSKKRALEVLEEIVPGFAGYKEKELRRESDRLLREKLAEQLRELGDKIDAVYEDIVDSKLTRHYDEMNRITALMDRLISKVEKADYGYAGFFSALKVREEELDRLYEYDRSMFADAVALEQKAAALADEVTAEGPRVGALIKELRKVLHGFEAKFDRRKDVMLKTE